MLSVVCCEARVASTHTLRVSICSNVGVSLFVLITKAVEGLDGWDRQM